MSEIEETALSKAIDTIGILVDGQSSLLRIIDYMDKRIEKLEDILTVKKD